MGQTLSEFFKGWTEAEVKARNERVRMKTAKQHNAKRIRQGEPKISPWEKEWKEKLEASGDWVSVKAQSIRVRLANGSWYKPDVSAYPIAGSQTDLPKLHCWDTKGGKKMKGAAKGVLAIKVAASLYHEIVWTLCWKENGVWQQQEVLP